MLQQCFLDDSKDKKQELAYVCAGFYGAKPAWNRFNQFWLDRLAAEGLDYYKSSEFWMLSGQFEKFRCLEAPHGRKAAEAVRERLQRAVSLFRGLQGIGVVVPVEIHREVMKHQSADRIFSKHIYNRAFEAVLLKATQLACRPGDEIAFVHDNGPDYDMLHDLYRSFKKLNSETSRTTKGFIPLDDKDTPGLQIADMLANSVQNRTARFIEEGDSSVDQIFMFRRSHIFIWTQRFAEAVLARNLHRIGESIPESLVELLRHEFS